MKKVVMMLFLLCFLTGCTVVRIDTKSIDNITSVILSKENTLYNTIGKGYKYYVPRGVVYIDSNDFNEKLYCNGDYYYLYLDVISYYYKKDFKYVENPELYYSKNIQVDDKKGYLEITQIEDYYLVEFMYNYAKIEALVKEDKINEVVLNATYTLSTIKYNDDVIKLILDEDYFTKKEEQYDIFTSTNNSTSFELEYEEIVEEEE
ncbi:MAG: hypothetical protein IJB71_01785 [Bacilli bacterium]|nr:hypothetical protein [Bacilli bacterium]